MLKTPIKIGLIFLKKDKERIFDLLQKKEIIHLIEIKKAEQTKKELGEIKTKVAKVKFALDFLSQFKEEKKDLKEKINQMLKPSFIYLTEEELKERVEKFKFEEVIEKCQYIQSKMRELEKKENELKKRKEFYQEWVGLSFNLEILKGIKTLRVFCGSFKNPKKFEDELREKTSLYEFRSFPSSKKDRFNFCLLYHFSEKERVEKLLERFEAQKVKEIENSPPISLELKKTEEALEKVFEEKKNLEEELKGLFQVFQELKIVYDYLNWCEKKIQAEFEGLQTEKLIFIKGWVEETRMEELRSELEKITKNFELSRLPLEKKELPPVILENRRIIQPYEMIMKIYGAPKPKEIDPVPWLAPFFTLFFGFCLGDAGYGLVLALFSFFLIKLIKSPPKEKRLLYLLFYGGVATFIMGLIFGSWFGITIEKIQLLDPIKSPLLMLVVAFLLGVFQLTFGIFLRMYSKMKNKMLKDALLDDLPWIYFIATLLLFGAKNFLNLPEKFANYLLISGALFVALTSSRKAKSIILKPFVGTLSLYGIMSYLSDALSYSRLVALGLSTTVVGYVVNLTAGVIKDIIPLAGVVVAGIILVFGHLFNIVISSLGAFVHSMRLQFVEFIPKFMEGGGNWFKPFSRESKYVKVISFP